MGPNSLQFDHQTIQVPQMEGYSTRKQPAGFLIGGDSLKPYLYCLHNEGNPHLKNGCLHIGEDSSIFKVPEMFGDKRVWDECPLYKHHKKGGWNINKPSFKAPKGDVSIEPCTHRIHGTGIFTYIYH